MPNLFFSLERSRWLIPLTLVMFLVRCILYNFSHIMYSSHQTVKMIDNDYSKTLVFFVLLEYFRLLTGFTLMVFLVKDLLYYSSCTMYFLHQNIKTTNCGCSMMPIFFVSLKCFCWLTCLMLIIFLVYECPWYNVSGTTYFSRILLIRTSKP